MNKSKYILFAFDDYYPTGGYRDEVFRCNTIKEVQNWIKDGSIYDNYHILNLETGEWTDVNIEELAKKEYCVYEEDLEC